jgi:UDP-glucose 4-epimerase
MQNYKNKKVLVTGGHGFIGRPLCQSLATIGAEVLALSRTSHPDFDGVRSVAIDLANSVSVDDLFAAFRPDIVLHLASHVVGSRTPDVVLSTYHNNLTSTIHVLLAARACGCGRVVLTDSLEGPDPDGEWPVPCSPYAAAKSAASAYGRMFHALFGLSVVILRVFMVYGPGQADDKKLVPYVITSLHRGEVPSFTSGTRQVDWVYLEDVVNAYVRAGIAIGADGHTIDIGSGTHTSVREVVQHLFDLMNRREAPSFGAVADRQMEQVKLADTSEAESLLGWRPRVGLRDGLQRTVEAYTQEWGASLIVSGRAKTVMAGS